MSKLFLYLIAGFISLSSCNQVSKNSISEEDNGQKGDVKSDSIVTQTDSIVTQTDLIQAKPLMEIIDTCGLRIYTPGYSRIDLVCGKMPEKNDSSVIFMASAAYTVKRLNKFEHTNIIGNHVSGGKMYKGAPSNSYRGAFIFYNDSAKFVYNDWAKEMNIAAENGGCGFAQDMMIHADTIVNHWHSNSVKNAYRALCMINGKVVIADSKGVIKFGDFINNLIKAGISEAIYLDMGGWNYSWYRNNDGKAIEIHTKPNKYATNWITFYR